VKKVSGEQLVCSDRSFPRLLAETALRTHNRLNAPDDTNK
jgi:hypothetical protein